MAVSIDNPHSLGEMISSNDLLCDELKLKERMNADGYLLFRNVIPEVVISKLVAKVSAILESCGWIANSNTGGFKSLITPCREGEDEYFRVVDRIVKLEEFHSLAHNNELMSVMKLVVGNSAFPHPLSIIRLVFPNNPEITTPPHQDFRNNQGTESLTAAWIPLHDCPVSRGGLAVLEGSHKYGVLPLKFHLGAGNRRAVLPTDMGGLRWLTTDYSSGDVLLFPSLTVHSALDNTDKNEMRISVDYRYQLEGEALVEQSLFPHFNRVSWDDIYEQWSSEQLQYYWKQKSFNLVSWDQTLQDLPDDHLDDAVKQTRHYKKTRQIRAQKLGFQN